MQVKRCSRGGIFFVVILFTFVLPIRGTDAAASFPPTQITDSPAAALPANTAILDPAKPVRVVIPAINLDTDVLQMGKEKNGEMSVPSGKSNDVGWYKYGTIPGNVGSAVFDAHVFAAFADLNKLKEGDEIFVITETNQKLRFVVGETEVYKLGKLSADTLFHQKDAKRLNLITCAGKLTKDKSTYTHRLVVFATFADATLLG